jgi:hypothetical protein
VTAQALGHARQREYATLAFGEITEERVGHAQRVAQGDAEAAGPARLADDHARVLPARRPLQTKGQAAELADQPHAHAVLARPELRRRAGAPERLAQARPQVIGQGREARRELEPGELAAPVPEAVYTAGQVHREAQLGQTPGQVFDHERFHAERLVQLEPEGASCQREP